MASTTLVTGHIRSRLADSLRCATVGLLVAVVVAACADASSVRPFTDEADPYPVVLKDETGLVTGIESIPVDPFGDQGPPAIRADPTDANAFFVTWFGGQAQDAALSFKRFQDGYLLRLEVHGRPGLLGGGTAIGIPRVIRIVTSRPIPLDVIQVGGSANT